MFYIKMSMLFLWGVKKCLFYDYTDYCVFRVLMYKFASVLGIFRKPELTSSI